jgi:hypothetical protein
MSETVLPAVQNTDQAQLKLASNEVASTVGVPEKKSMTVFGVSLWKILAVVAVLFVLLNYTETGRTYKLKIAGLTQTESPTVSDVLRG